jgi:zinc transport system permease protein
MELLGYDFVQRGILAGVMIAIASSLVGIFLVLRGLAFIGAGLSHFAFGGIALALFLGLEPFTFTAILLLILSNLIEFLRGKGLKGDIPLAVVFSGGMALAVVLISISGGFKESLFAYLFGNIFMVTYYELVAAVLVSILTLLTITRFYRILLLTTFNEDIARLNHRKSNIVNYVLLSVSSLVIVVSIKAVGILLTSALIVIPQAVSLMIAKSITSSLLLSVLISSSSALLGMFIAIHFGLAPGGIIVLIMVATFVMAALFMNK